MEKKRGIFRRIILPVLLVLVVIVVIVAKLGSNKEKMEANASISNKKATVFPVTIIYPKNDTISQDFEMNGNFIADHDLNFVSEISGRIKSLKIENGDYVTAGKVIATIDNEQTAIELSLALANQDKAQTDLNKYETMLAGNAASKQQVEDAKMNLRSAKSKVDGLRRQMRLSTLVAPISGVIADLKVDKGSFLSPGTPIAQIVDIKSLKMSVKLLDNQVVRLKNDQVVTIIPDLYNNTEIMGKVSSIAPKADNSRRYATEIKFVNPSKTPLKSGMTGKVQFRLGGSKQALTIPLKCLVGSVQNPKVYVIDGNKAKLVSIKVGSISEDKLEIVSGLSASNQVVATGQLNLTNGSKISIIH